MVDKAESFFSWVARQRQKTRAELELGLRRRVREAFRPWFSIPRWSALPIYTAYLPESLYFGRQDRAFHSLVKRFCAHDDGLGKKPFIFKHFLKIVCSLCTHNVRPFGSIRSRVFSRYNAKSGIRQPDAHWPRCSESQMIRPS
jgi:hypothetical protein